MTLANGAIFVVAYYGDLPRDGHSMSAHGTLEDALIALGQKWGKEMDYGWDTPDPEDDRIVVWRCQPGEPVSVAWHFSGWHWEPDAADLPGGPQEQGALLGNGRSLYELAMEDF